MSRALVTGASGLVGRALCDELRAHGWQVRAALRSASVIEGVEGCVIGDLAEARWAEALADVHAVFHLAAVVHSRGTPAQYEAVNVGGTERLARAAVQAGARRLVFVSTIKVNGEATPLQRPFRAKDEPRPQDEYARSKLRAEQALAAVPGLEAVVVRPPLVYGPGVRANFLRLMQLVDSGLPLPFASIRNRRSLIYAGNLASLLRACATHPRAAGRTFLAADGEDLSTPELVRRIATALGRTPRLLPFPPLLLPPKLSGSLTVDAAETCAALDWRAPYSVDDGLARTAAWYRLR